MNLYFNHAFAKQPLQETVEAMSPFLREFYENPLTESPGAEVVRKSIEEARGHVAALLNASPEEIIFVSSGTEANNWALKGTAQVQKKRNHIILSAIEHFSVFQTAKFLERNGFDLTILPVDSNGHICVDDVVNAIRPSTFLVSILSGSDEIGTIQNWRAIGDLKHRFSDVLFHTDAVQYLCYEFIDVKQLPVDLITFTSNALYGPAGVAALFIRKGTRIVPLLHGGMQEQGLRPGLQSTAMIVGFGRAASINVERKKEWRAHLAQLQSILVEQIEQTNTKITGDRINRLVDNIHVLVDVDGEALLTLLAEEGIIASTGSTCYEYAQKESHVLQALGVSKEAARGAVLFTLGIQQTEREIRVVGEAFASALKHLRKLKP